jgi:hypothetical protein
MEPVKHEWLMCGDCKHYNRITHRCKDGGNSRTFGIRIGPYRKACVNHVKERDVTYDMP